MDDILETGCAHRSGSACRVCLSAEIRSLKEDYEWVVKENEKLKDELAALDE